MASCKDCKHYPMCGFSKYTKTPEKCLDFWDMSDVVKVVRCKDCKFCERDHTLDGGGDEYYYCWHVVMEHGQARPNEFCCYGERKDNE